MGELNMKCPSCGIEHAGGDCPLCGLPEFAAPTPEAFQEALQALVPEYRRAYLKTVSAVLTVPRYTAAEGRLTPDPKGTRRIPFGTGEALSSGVRWLPDAFARVPQLPELPLRVTIHNGQTEREEIFSVPNPYGADFLRVGLQLKEAPDGLFFTAFVRSGDGKAAASAPCPLNGAV